MSDTVLAGIMHPDKVDVLADYLRWQNLAQGQAQTGLTRAQIPLTGAQTELTHQQALSEPAKRALMGAQGGLYGAQAQLATANAGLAGANTGLVGQQTTGASLQNEQARLALARTGYLYGLAGIPVPGGGGAPAGAAGVTAIGGAGGLPGGQPPAVSMPMPAGVGGTDGGTGGSGAGVPGAAPGGAPGGAPGAPGVGAPPAPGTVQFRPAQQFPGSLGQAQLGVPMPPLMAASVLTSQDPAGAFRAAQEARRQAVFSQVSGAAPADYPAAMQRLYQAGWITPQMLADAQNHPEGRARILAATQTPEAYQTMMAGLRGQGLQPNAATGEPELSPTVIAGKQQTARATAAGTAAGSGALVDVKVTAPDGKVYVHQVPAGQVQGFLAEHSAEGAQRTTTIDMINPAVTISPATYVGRITGSENPGGPANAKNPRSSATGDGQFIESTWLATVRAAQPAWAQGLNDQQVLAQRGNREHSAEMTWALAQQSAPLLVANGLPVNSLTLGMSHALGPGDMKKVLSVRPTTPMSSIVSPDAMQANPQWKGKTASDVLAHAIKVYGVNAVDISQPFTASVAPAAGAGLAGGSRGVAGVGAPVLPPQQAAALEVAKDSIRRDGEEVTKGVAAAGDAQQTQTQLLQLRTLIPDISAGAASGWRQGVQNVLATFGPQFAQDFVKTLSAHNINPAAAGATQEFNKLAIQAMGAAAHANNPAGGLGVNEIYAKAYPNLEMQPGAIKDMTNVLLMQQQRNVDYGQGRNDFFLHAQDQFSAGQPYQRIQNFDKMFLQENPPQVYAAAAAVMNGKPYAEWSRGLSPTQQQSALRTMWRADPTAVGYGPGGQAYHMPAPVAPGGAQP